VLILVVPSVGVGQSPSPPYSPPTFNYGEGRIDVLEAVRLTLANDPNLLLSREDVRFQAGIAQELGGAFDWVLSSELKYDYKETEVRASSIDSEKQKRDDTANTRDNLCSEADEAEDELAQLLTAQSDPDGGIRIPADPSLDTQLRLIDTLIAQAADPAQRDALIGQRADFLDVEVRGARERATNLRFTCNEASEALRKLGDIPEFEESAQGRFNLQLDKLYRSGLLFSPFITATYEHGQFVGKRNGFFEPLTGPDGQPVIGESGTPVERFIDFGGKNIEDLYRVSVGFDLNLPLLRGRGAADTAADEAAALKDLQASELTALHAASESVLQSVVAYWNLLAAQERVDVLIHSAELEKQLVDITDQLIAGDEVPRAERSRALAGEANARSQLGSAHSDLVSARLALARTMGLAVESEANAPLAQGPFPPPPPEQALAEFDRAFAADLAVENLYDRQAALATTEAGQLAAEGARLQTRALLDLGGSVFTQAVGEKSFGEAVDRWTFPNGSVNVNFEKPIGNNERLGRLQQAEAQLRQSEIRSVDLDRTIRLNVVQSVEALREAIGRLREAEEAARYYQETIDGELEKLKLGESTLVDSITTEQQRTNALLGLVAARQQVAVLIAQLRFDTATLFAEGSDRTSVSLEELTTLPALAKSSS
jgi:outer membrane protein TolC